MSTSTNHPPSFAEHTLGELDAGVFEKKFDRAMRDTAFAVVTTDDMRKKGKVTIEFTMERFGDNHQIKMSHKIIAEAPTAKGKRIEHDASESILHVNKSGTVTTSPETQTEMFPKGETV